MGSAQRPRASAYHQFLGTPCDTQAIRTLSGGLARAPRDVARATMNRGPWVLGVLAPWKLSLGV
eukprot:11676659-Alexandrium_andersonii.AAC.1